MGNVTSLDSYRARTAARRHRPLCLDPACDQPAVWFTRDGHPFSCNRHNPPVPQPAPPVDPWALPHR